MTSVGSIGGGWMSGAMINRGVPVNKARKIAMLICALLVVPVVTAANVTSLWMAVGIIGLAAAAHQGWSANIFTTASDIFPKESSRLCCWAGCFRWFYRRNDIINFVRIYCRSNWKLHGVIHHMRFSVSACFGYHATLDI